ncbi:MAG: TolC family protein [Spirochaetes bacterium]|nr:TolC family protein [Spirochaetota bacterium]
MKLKISIIIILLICAGAFCPPESSAGNIYNLDQIRALALSNSRVLSRLNLSIDSSILNERATRYENLPSLSVGASVDGNLWGGDTHITDNYDARATVTLSQQIWDGGRNSVLSSINRLSTEIARKEALQEFFNVLASADAAYYGVLEAQAALAAANSLLEVSKLGLAIAEIRREGGFISIGDYLQAVAENEAKKAEHSLARRDLALSLARLKAITGLREIGGLEAINFEIFEPAIHKLSQLTDNEIDNVISAFREKVFANNPLLASSVLSSRRAERGVNLAQRDYFPSINLGISAGLVYNNIHGRETAPGRITISGRVPLDVWVIRNNVNNRRITQQQALLDQHQTELLLDIEIQAGILNCIAQASSVISSRKALNYAEKQLENRMELYRLASASISELSDAMALVSSSQNRYIRAKYNFLLTLSVIRSLGGFDCELHVLEMMTSR